MCEIQCKLVLLTLIVLRCVLVVVIEVVVALVGVVETHGIAAVVGHTLVVHRGIRCIIDVIEPFIHADAQCACRKFLDKFGGEEELVDVARIKA